MKKTTLSLITALALIFSNAIASDPSSHSSVNGKTGYRLNLKPGDYKPNTIIVKLKSDVRSQCRVNGIDVNSLSQKFSTLGVSDANKMFPRAEVPSMMRTVHGQPLVDLSLIYRVHYTGNISIENALQLLNSDENVVYAEPDYIYHSCYTPNEPSGNLTLQYHLTNIQAYAAWDVWKGDTNTVIGIVDSGSDIDHPDLQPNLKLNYADPIDGTDNDGDGYIDNFHGWDVSENDNDPTVVGSTHGSHVSGCADAATDNSIGVASPAFNCRFLPVKVSLDASTTSIDNGYEGITYAADHGVNVINCSWGGAGGSSMGQDVINYATLNRNVTVVVAAGNDGLDEDFYPASFDHVVSVAATDNADHVASFSNFGNKVDVCAPGNNIYATVYNNSYTYMSGTSMASPVAAGAAAMIKSRFPNYDALQVAAQLRVTADNIDGINNAQYANKLGGGRINMFNSLTDTTAESVDVSNLKVTDGNDDAFVANDTLFMTALFTNLLKPTTNLTCVISAQSAYVTPINTTFTIGAMNTSDTISNYNVPFTYKVRTTAPLNAIIPFRITMTDGTYSDIYAYTVTVNVDYINVQINHIGTTISSLGRTGYSQANQGGGMGVTYMSSATNLYEAGLMIGDQAHQVSDGIRAAPGASDNDFASTLRVAKIIPGVSDFDTYGKFQDQGANALHVLVTHHSYAWATAPDLDYVIVDYSIMNNGTSALSNVWAGIFADWDILPDFNHNSADQDIARKMGYAYSNDTGGVYIGTKLLTSVAGFNNYAIDNIAGGGGGLDITTATGFVNADKYTALSTSRPQGGVTLPGNDVCNVVSTGPLSIAAGDSVRVAFAIIAGYDLASIQASADAAQIRYDNLINDPTAIQPIALPTYFSLEQNYPNPVIGKTNIKFNLSESNNTELSLYNVTGQKVKTLVNEKLNAGSYTLYEDLSDVQTGVYYLKLTSGDHSQIRPLTVSH